MKVGIFSDTHLGFDEKGERAQESFGNLSQAIRLCIEMGADLMVLPGDVFDAPVPSHNTLFHAVHSFAAAKSASSNVEITLEKEGSTTKVNYSGTPILAIHGNHEYLGKETRTALDILNLAGVLVYFHAAKIIVEKPGEGGIERLAVHGLGAVPEKKALAAMQQWNPKPLPDAANIILVHQSFKEFMAIDDEMVATLSLDDLPKGFDLIVDGHLHWANRQELGPVTHGGNENSGHPKEDFAVQAKDAAKTVFLLAGSTIATAIKRLECESSKGVHIFDTASKELVFHPLPRQRRMFYHQITLKEADAQTALQECRGAIEGDLKQSLEMNPLIRVNLKGSVKKGLGPSDINLSGVFAEYSGRVILSISKNFSAPEFKRKIADLREMQKSRLSVAQLGFEMLEKNLRETDFGEGFSVKELFALLSDEEIDKAMALVTKS